MTHQIHIPDGWTADPTTIAANLVLRGAGAETTNGATTIVPKIVIHDPHTMGNGINNDGIVLNPDQAEAIGQRLLILARAARNPEQWNATLRSPDAG